MSDETAPPTQIKISWLIGTAATFALFVVIGAYSARMTWDYSDYDQDRAAQRYQTLAKVQETENKLINPIDDNKKPTAEWVDQGKGIIRIPIEEAMAKEVDALKDKPAAVGIEINPPAPAAAAPAPTTGATTNAAPAKPAAPGAKPAASAPKPAPATPPATPKT